MRASLLALALACASATPTPPPGPEVSLGALPLRLAPPAGWALSTQPDGGVILGPQEKLRHPSWIRVDPGAEATTEATGWLAPLEEKLLRPDPEVELEITRLTGTFAVGRARYPVQADVARRAELPEVRASLETLRAR